MTHPLVLSPRYRLDDDSPWLEGIDPIRHYWIALNGNDEMVVPIPGLLTTSISQLKEAIQKLRGLKQGEQMTLERSSNHHVIRCISDNCYAVEGKVEGAAIWHLFDHETLESLMMTAHPDWQCAPRDLELGRKLLFGSWHQKVAA